VNYRLLNPADGANPGAIAVGVAVRQYHQRLKPGAGQSFEPGAAAQRCRAIFQPSDRRLRIPWSFNEDAV
jgi:hypothetical protein